MPELPEVKCHAEKLSSLFKGLTLNSFVIHKGPYLTSEKDKYKHFQTQTKEFLPHKVNEILSKGKYLYFLLEGNQYFALGVHHGMEGSWCTDSQNKHIVLELIFSEDKKIFFQDSRRFGTFSLLNEEELKTQLSRLGPDVFQLENYQQLLDILKNKKHQKHRLCEILMNQAIISGIGNYLRADIMYHAKLSPHRLISSFSEEEIKTLFSSMKYIVQKSYDSKATTAGNYNSSIHHGNYEFLIYGKKECHQKYKVEYFNDKQKRRVWWVPSLQN